MPGSVQSIERAAAVLRLLAVGTGRLGCVEVATSLDLAKGTAHGILRTLKEVGFVEQDRATGKYQLGAGLQSLYAQQRVNGGGEYQMHQHEQRQQHRA